MPDLKNEHLKIREVVDQFSRSSLSVPEFQRDYVWRPSKAAKLLDSLYKNYPISCLLAWESTIKVEHRSNRPPHAATLRWIIDGQQRVRTLQKVRDGDLAIMFHVDKQEFSRPTATTKYDHAWISVTDIWNDATYRDIRNGMFDARERRLDNVRKMLEYEIPLIVMVGHDFNDAVESFGRINTLGIRLKKSEIESAKIAEKHATFIRDEFMPFLTHLKSLGFQRLSSSHLFRACAFIARPEAGKRILLHEMETTEVRQAWKRTKRATLNALKVLQNELGVYDMDFLWSGNLLVPVVCLCDKVVNERNDREIAAWIALAALHHRYSQGSDTAVDQDLKACKAPDAISALLKNIRGKRVGLDSGEWSFQGTIADRSSLFAAYVACRNLNAVDLITGGKIGSNVDRHHIFPRALFTDRQAADEIANIAFISGDTNKSISDAHPSVYLAKIPEAVLRSQAIPTDRSLWDIDRADAFWQTRRELLSEAFNQYIRQALPKRRKL
jgi:hypothetical protein